MTLPVLNEPAAMVDLTGLTCPGPILGAREILEGLRDGQVLLLLSDCPGTRDDLFAWARQTGNGCGQLLRGADFRFEVGRGVGHGKIMAECECSILELSDAAALGLCH